MASKAYAGYASMTPRRRGERADHWRNDDRVPALRLRVPSKLTGTATGTAAATGDTTSIIQPIAMRDLYPFAIRESSCQHLEHRQQARRCLAGDTREITLGQQVAYCMNERHRQCSRYRTAGGLRRILPQRLAVYTIMIVAMIALIVVAGIQTARHDPGANDGASTNVELVGE